MKHLKNFSNFLKEDKLNRDFEISIFDLFRPFTNLIKNINLNIKLNSIANDYDNYLNEIYKKYLSINKNKNIKSNNHKVNVITSISSKPDYFIDDKFSVLNSEPKSSPSTFIEEPPKPEKLEEDNFKELILDYLKSGNTIELKKLRREYEQMYDRDISKSKIIKQEIQHYNKLKKVKLEELVQYKKNTEDYKKTNILINDYNEKIFESDKKYNNYLTRANQHKWYLDEMDKIISDFKNNKIKESIDVENSWNKEDMEKINHLINPYQIEEYYLKANNLIENSKNHEKTKRKWESLINDIFKKWYFIFDVKNLRHITPNLNTFKNKPNYELRKEFSYISLILEELFPKLKTYSWPFKFLNDDRNKYFILLTSGNIFLLKKVLFHHDIISFQLITILIPNEKNKTIISKKGLLNTGDDRINLKFDSKNIELYKESNEYPILIIRDGYVYSTIDMEDFHIVSLKNSNIYSMKDDSFKKIMKDSGINNYEEKLASEKIYNKIKKLDL